MNKIKRFLEPAFENGKEFLKMFIFRSILSIYTVLIVFFAQKFIALIEIKDIEGIKIFTAYFAILTIAFLIFYKTCRRWDWTDFYFNIKRSIDTKYMSKFVLLDNIKIENYGTGKLISIIGKGTSTWVDFILHINRIGIELIVYIVSTIFILKNLGNIYIAIFFIAILILNIILISLSKKSLPIRRKTTEARINYDRQIAKMIMSKFEILQNDKIDLETENLRLLNNENWKNTNDLWKHIINMFIIPETILGFMYIGLLILIIYLDISIPIIVSLFMMFTLLRRVFDRIVVLFKDIVKDFYYVEKLWELFDETPLIKGLEIDKEFKIKSGTVLIQNIFFSYTSINVFKDFSLEIEGNKKTALVGNSGSGKTTLAKLISGFISPQEGNIIVDGQNLKDINIMSYYKNIGYLTQEPSVFDGTIYENLIYGVSDIIEENILRDAIKRANCDFIYDLKDSIHTEIGERGVRLSGGQKQRLAIAKLFIKDPKIIILDEPTSALDSFSEEKINESFEELFKGRTVIIIAHRLQTVKNADKILVIEKGKVIETGTHKELKKKKGYYYNMLELQSGF